MKKTLALTLALAGAVGAQTHVVPTGFATKEGGSYHWIVGQYDRGRAQQIYAKSSMPTTSFSINSFSMRRDGLRTSAFEAHTVNMQVFMSNTPNDPPGKTTFAWADNHGPDYALVMRQRTISWGADPLPATPPAPFSVTFPLDKPFPYTGKAFVIEWTSDFTGTPTQYSWNWVTDAEYYPASATTWSTYSSGSRVNIGTSCKPPGATSDPACFGYYPYPGGPFWKYMYLRVSTADVPTMLILGSTDKNYGALALPFSLTPIGAPGCSLYIDIVLTFPSKTDAGGRADWKLGAIPRDAILVGADYYVQMFAFDKTFNTAGLISTYGRKYTVGTKGFDGVCPGWTYYDYLSSATASPAFYMTQPCARYYSSRANIVKFN